MANDLEKLTCTECDGTGKRTNALDGQEYKCNKCGGHKWTPGAGHGYATFYRPPCDRYPGSERVMVLHRDFEKLDKWRVTMFAPNGPITHHTDCKYWSVMGELKEFYETADAGDLLDEWCRDNYWIINVHKEKLTCH